MKEKMTTLIQEYSLSLEELKNKQDALVKTRDQFPSGLHSAQELEKFMFAAANLKHGAIALYKDVAAYSKSLQIDIDIMSAKIKLGDSDASLKEMGFGKITDALREAFINSNDELVKLKKLGVRLETVASTSEKLIRAFEADETDFRKSLELKHKMIGL